MVFGKYVKRLDGLERKVANTLFENHSSLFPITMDAAGDFWELNWKSDKIIIPFDMMKDEILFEDNPEKYKSIKRPDYIIVEVGKDIILRGVDVKHSGLGGRHDVGQISGSNLQGLIKNSPYLKKAVKEIGNKFPRKKIYIGEGYYLISSLKNSKDKLEDYVERFLRKKEKITLCINKEGIYIKKNGEEILELPKNYEVKIISVERFHNDISRIKNRINEIGFYHTPVIAVFGFNGLGEVIKQFEYSQNKGIKTYSPELEKIEGTIKTITSLDPLSILDEGKNLKNEYFLMLESKKNRLNNTIKKLEERVEKILSGIKKRQCRLEEIPHELEQLEEESKIKYKLFQNIERTLSKDLDERDNLTNYILALESLKKYYDVNESNYQEITTILKNVRERSYEERRKAIESMRQLFNFAFPSLRPDGKESSLVSGIYSLSYNVLKEYLRKRNELNSQINMIHQELEGEIYIKENVKDKEKFSFVYEGGLFRLYDENYFKLNKRKEEYENHLRFLNGERKKFYNLTNPKILKKNYKEIEKIQNQLIEEQNRIREKMLFVKEGEKERLRKKYIERAKRDINLNKKVKLFNKTIKYPLVGNESANSALVVYLSLDPREREVCKIVFYDYKTIDDI